MRQSFGSVPFYNFSSFYWQIQSIVRTLYQVLEEDALELKTEINHKNGNIHSRFCFALISSNSNLTHVPLSSNINI